MSFSTRWAVILSFPVLAAAASEQLEPALSPDPKVLEILAQLGDNECAVLPEAQCVGEWNELTKRFGFERKGPGGRDFTIKMAWAPDRKRAFFCGANHGVPHKYNDVWEYDLAANTWAMLWAPDFNFRPGHEGFDLANVTMKDGFFMTRKGAPLPCGHTWWQLTYDPKLKGMLWIVRNKVPASDEELAQHGLDAKQMDKGTGLWAYLPYEKRWQHLKTGDPQPKGEPASMLEYIPEMGGSLYFNARGNVCMLYDAQQNKWKDLNAKFGPNAAPMFEQVAAWDAANGVVVAHGGPKKGSNKRTTHYDPKTNAWTLALEAPANDVNVPRGHDAATPFYYDPVGRVCLLYGETDSEKGKDAERFMWAYDAKTKTWTKLAPKGPPIPEGNARMTAYFDPAHNVFVILNGTSVWVYRYKRADK